MRLHIRVELDATEAIRMRLARKLLRGNKQSVSGHCKEIARKIGISARVLRGWEYQERYPTWGQYRAWCAAVGLEPRSVFDAEIDASAPRPVRHYNYCHDAISPEELRNE